MRLFTLHDSQVIYKIVKQTEIKIICSNLLIVEIGQNLIEKLQNLKLIIYCNVLECIIIPNPTKYQELFICKTVVTCLVLKVY